MTKAIWGSIILLLIICITGVGFFYSNYKAYHRGYDAAEVEFSLVLKKANEDHVLLTTELEKKYEKTSRAGIRSAIKQLYTVPTSKNKGQTCRELCGVDTQPKQEHLVTCINEEDSSGSQSEGKYLYTVPEIRPEANAVNDAMYQLRDSSLKQETYIEHGIEVDKGLTKEELDSFSELFNQKLTKEE